MLYYKKSRNSILLLLGVELEKLDRVPIYSVNRTLKINKNSTRT